MTERLILFDIDGTILVSGGASFAGMARASDELYGKHFSWQGIDSSGALDPLLFKEALHRNGVEASEVDYQRFHDLYVHYLPEELDRYRDRMRIMPGVHDLLAQLRDRSDVVVGLLTGNYTRTAQLKLEAAGFEWSWFELGAFGEDGGARRDLVPVAIERFSERFGKQIVRQRVLIVGDTPRDVDCALANDCQVLAVGTGIHSPEVLLKAGAHRVVSDLTDPEPLFDMLR